MRQSRRSLFQNKKLESGVEPQTVRLVHALAVLQFATNNTCSLPFHVPLTEAIITNGGTQKLVKILNRVGEVASIETANCLAVKVVEDKLKRGITSYLAQDKFTVVTVYNVDILQP